LQEACQLVKAVRRLRREDFPRHQLHLLAEAALKQSPQEARLTWSYQWARMNDGVRKAFLESLGWVGTEGAGAPPLLTPFVALGRRRNCRCGDAATGCADYLVCPLIDIVEAWDFIQGDQRCRSELEGGVDSGRLSAGG
ncbi:MAG: hypothetical protein K6T75_08580, partial [Acetobacteraceae bacterium]|nr:hypothetical protein [Acetobacteraceae bacterium]